MKLRAIILGCGSSGGVPRLGGPDGKGDWGDCDPSDPRNRRRRCSLLVQRADEDGGWDRPDLTTILIDTSPDMREQLLDAGVGHLDAVFNTHDHADQSHGIDDLRALVIKQQARMPVYFSERTSPALLDRFRYCFESNDKTGYPAILEAMPLKPGEPVRIEGGTGPLEVLPVLVEHGGVQAFAFRIGGEGGQGPASFAYSPDLHDIPEASWPHLEGVPTWICDTLRYRPHPSHAHLEKTLGWFERAGVERGVLTNLHLDLDYAALDAKTPPYVTPAHDGMVVITGD